MKKGLNIGCNEWRIESTPEIEWINVDIDKNENIKPDIQCDARELPFKDEEFDVIYAGHILEHFTENEDVLKEWSRVLKKGGEIIICVPDIEKSLWGLRNRLMVPSFFQNVVFGADDRKAQNHHQAFSADLLALHMSKYFKDLAELDECPYWVANVFWQTTIKGIK